MLDSWKKAWEQKDLGAYMSFYDSGFQSRGMDFKAWRKHREKLNQKYRLITVDITDLKIERTSAVMASVRFTQKYEADDYEDEGLKSLLLVKRGKDWRSKKKNGSLWTRSPARKKEIATCSSLHHHGGGKNRESPVFWDFSSPSFLGRFVSSGLPSLVGFGDQPLPGASAESRGSVECLGPP